MQMPLQQPQTSEPPFKNDYDLKKQDVQTKSLHKRQLLKNN